MNNTEPGFRITGIQHIGNPEDFQAFNNEPSDDGGDAGDHEDDFAENMRRNILVHFVQVEALEVNMEKNLIIMKY